MSPSLRTQIAAQAMAGWLSSHHPEAVFSPKMAERVASEAVGFADVLLQKLGEPPPQVTKVEIWGVVDHLRPSGSAGILFDKAVEAICSLLDTHGLLKEPVDECGR